MWRWEHYLTAGKEGLLIYRPVMIDSLLGSAMQYRSYREVVPVRLFPTV